MKTVILRKPGDRRISLSMYYSGHLDPQTPDRTTASIPLLS